MQYYYRAERINGRVVKRYVGRGPIAEAAAAEDAAKRGARTTRRLAEVDDRRKIEEVVAGMRDLDKGAGSLLRAALLCAGYHQHHRGKWRKRRGQSEK